MMNLSLPSCLILFAMIGFMAVVSLPIVGLIYWTNQAGWLAISPFWGFLPTAAAPVMYWAWGIE